MDGPITAELNASINKRDMYFSIAFWDPMPDGRRFKIREAGK